MKRRRYRWIMTGLLLTVAAGCAVNQAEEIETYRKVLAGGHPQTVKLYEPRETLTLQRALELALARNEQLAIAGEDYLQALIDKDRAFARFLPTISFTPSYMREEKTHLGAGNPLVSEFVPASALDVPAQSNLNVDPFMDIPVLQATESKARQQRYLLLDRKEILLLEVAQTYYQVLMAESRVKTLKHSVTTARQAVEDARIQEKAGTATFVDVARAESQLAAIRNQLIQARNDVVASRAMLSLQMGITACEGPLADNFAPPDRNLQWDHLLQVAGQNRQDLQAARQQVQAAAKLLQSAWAEYFPSVSLNLTYFFSRQSFPNDVSWTSLIQANVPIFTAGLVHADVRTAYSRLRQAQSAESHFQQKVIQDLRITFNDLNSDAERIEQSRIQVESAREFLHKAKTAYKAGTGTLLEQLDAADQLRTAKLSLADRVFTRNVDYLRILRALGVLDIRPSKPIPDISLQESLNKPDAGQASETAAALPGSKGPAYPNVR